MSSFSPSVESRVESSRLSSRSSSSSRVSPALTAAADSRPAPLQLSSPLSSPNSAYHTRSNSESGRYSYGGSGGYGDYHMDFSPMQSDGGADSTSLSLRSGSPTKRTSRASHMAPLTPYESTPFPKRPPSPTARHTRSLANLLLNMSAHHLFPIDASQPNQTPQQLKQQQLLAHMTMSVNGQPSEYITSLMKKVADMDQETVGAVAQANTQGVTFQGEAKPKVDSSAQTKVDPTHPPHKRPLLQPLSSASTHPSASFSSDPAPPSDATPILNVQALATLLKPQQAAQMHMFPQLLVQAAAAATKAEEQKEAQAKEKLISPASVASPTLNASPSTSSLQSSPSALTLTSPARSPSPAGSGKRPPRSQSVSSRSTKMGTALSPTRSRVGPPGPTGDRDWDDSFGTVGAMLQRPGATLKEKSTFGTPPPLFPNQYHPIQVPDEKTRMKLLAEAKKIEAERERKEIEEAMQKEREWKRKLEREREMERQRERAMRELERSPSSSSSPSRLFSPPLGSPSSRSPSAAPTSALPYDQEVALIREQLDRLNRGGQSTPGGHQERTTRLVLSPKASRANTNRNTNRSQQGTTERGRGERAAEESKEEQTQQKQASAEPSAPPEDAAAAAPGDGDASADPSASPAPSSSEAAEEYDELTDQAEQADEVAVAPEDAAVAAQPSSESSPPSDPTPAPARPPVPVLSSSFLSSHSYSDQSSAQHHLTQLALMSTETMQVLQANEGVQPIPSSSVETAPPQEDPWNLVPPISALLAPYRSAASEAASLSAPALPPEREVPLGWDVPPELEEQLVLNTLAGKGWFIRPFKVHSLIKNKGQTKQNNIHNNADEEDEPVLELYMLAPASLRLAASVAAFAPVPPVPAAVDVALFDPNAALPPVAGHTPAEENADAAQREQADLHSLSSLLPDPRPAPSVPSPRAAPLQSAPDAHLLDPVLDIFSLPRLDAPFSNQTTLTDGLSPEERKLMQSILKTELVTRPAGEEKQPEPAQFEGVAQSVLLSVLEKSQERQPDSKLHFLIEEEQKKQYDVLLSAQRLEEQRKAAEQERKASRRAARAPQKKSSKHASSRKNKEQAPAPASDNQEQAHASAPEDSSDKTEEAEPAATAEPATAADPAPPAELA